MKKVAYDKYYETDSYFGNPYPEMITFFKEYNHKGLVLDLGCGQGRDALTLGKLGYDVIGVDISSVGIKQLNDRAKELNINVKGEVADIYKYKVTENVDIVMLDSMFHFYSKDYDKESAFLTRLLTEASSETLFCIFTQTKKETQNKLHKVIKQSKINTKIMLDKNIKYPDFNADFNMLVLKKK